MGIYPNYDNCRRFYDCTSGVPVELECFDGYGYNAETSNCDVIGKQGVCQETQVAHTTLPPTDPAPHSTSPENTREPQGNLILSEIIC